MTSPAAGPGPGLGERLRRVRGGRGLSVRELARRAGCSASLISQIERGRSAPSAGILYALANELRCSLDYLFGVGPGETGGDGWPGVTAPPPGGPAPPAAATAVLPAAATAALPAALPADRQYEPPGPVPARGALAGLSTPGASVVQRADSRRVIELSSGVRWERLTPRTDGHADFLEVVYAPRGHSTDSHRPVRHEGREYLLVLDGCLHADIGFDTYVLSSGDSLAFDPATPHQYRNPTDEVVRCVSIVVHDDSAPR